MFDLNNHDVVVWPGDPATRRMRLRAEARKLHRAGWCWWVVACALVAAALLIPPEIRVGLIVIAAAPAVWGLRLISLAQDLNDSALEDL